MATDYTEAQLKRKTLADLRKLAEENYESDEVKALKKADLIDLILNGPINEADDELEDDDELDDDEDQETPTEEPELDDDELDDDGITPVDVDTEGEYDDELDDDEEPTPAPAPTKAAIRTAVKGTADKVVDKIEPNGDTYTAKQIATRIGTDPKLLRKFFRSDASTVEAVGLGGRYEFPKADLDKIKSEFESWKLGHKTRGTKREGAVVKDAPKRAAMTDELDDDELELDDELESMDTDDELELELEDDDELED